jgi:hypothetical protein
MHFTRIHYIAKQLIKALSKVWHEVGFRSAINSEGFIRVFSRPTEVGGSNKRYNWVAIGYMDVSTQNLYPWPIH